MCFAKFYRCAAGAPARMPEKSLSVDAVGPVLESLEQARPEDDQDGEHHCERIASEQKEMRGLREYGTQLSVTPALEDACDYAGLIVEPQPVQRKKRAGEENQPDRAVRPVHRSLHVARLL